MVAKLRRRLSTYRQRWNTAKQGYEQEQDPQKKNHDSTSRPSLPQLGLENPEKT
ncbi:MAG: hypothetical protein LLG20_27685 [Acidobacteriales bacterium]|nr:hypothetical protein [Terriglobales bacterium]